MSRWPEGGWTLVLGEPSRLGHVVRNSNDRILSKADTSSRVAGTEVGCRCASVRIFRNNVNGVCLPRPLGFRPPGQRSDLLGKDAGKGAREGRSGAASERHE